MSVLTRILTREKISRFINDYEGIRAFENIIQDIINIGAASSSFGTVTSIDIAAGSSRVTASGGPVISAGVITIDVVAANLTGIPESGVTNLTADLSALTISINSNNVLNWMNF